VSTLLSVGSELAIPDRNGSNSVLIIGTKQGLEESLNQVCQEITRRNLDVQPTIRVRPGFPFNVIVAKDLILEPYGGP
jgi:type IV secretion system protein TrbI